MLDDVFQQFHGRIESTIADLKRDLAKIRTGRANPGLLEGIQVEYYGQLTPLQGVASVHVADPRLITIKPWDKSAIPAIEKAIRASDLGLTPSNDGEKVLLAIPQLTEERRKDLAKQIHKKAEEHRVAVRNERRDANEAAKALEKDKTITADELKKALERVQKDTDGAIARIDEIAKAKEQEVMTV